MDPTVVAAWIAAGVSVLTLAGTLAAQYYGYRATSNDAEKTAEKAEKAAEEQRKQLDKTLKAQSDQLDRTLAEQRTRTLNERFATAAEQLGSDKAAVRLAGVYAMAGLADDWEENRQTCVDVLCAYLRMPYEPDPGPDAPEPQRLAFRAIREVRHTVIRVIAARLTDRAAVSWQGLNLDFTCVVFDGGDFREAKFSGGTVFFSEARFSGDAVLFHRAQFSGAEVYFNLVQVRDGMIWFREAEFSGGKIWFNVAEFSDLVSFHKAKFSGSEIYFAGTKFSDRTHFSEAQFSGGEIDFVLAEFSSGEISFGGAQFSGGTVSFSNAQFTGSRVDFTRTLSDDTGDFVETQFPAARSTSATLAIGQSRLNSLGPIYRLQG